MNDSSRNFSNLDDMKFAKKREYENNRLISKILINNRCGFLNREDYVIKNDFGNFVDSLNSAIKSYKFYPSIGDQRQTGILGSNHNISRELLERFILFGHAVEYNSITADSILDFNGYDYISACPGWENYLCGFSAIEIQYIAKALIVLSSIYCWPSGSGASVNWIYRELEKRDKNLALITADWIFAFSSNRYEPFGGNNGGAKSLIEYQNYQNQKRQRLIASAQNEEKIKLLAAQKREKASILSRKHCDRSNSSKLKYHDIMDSFQSNSLFDKLEILADSTMNPDYFNIDLDSISNDELLSISQDLRNKLLFKFSTYRKSKWRRFYEKLSELNIPARESRGG